MDNGPELSGAARISRLIARTHVLIRVKSDIPLRRAGDFLPDGSYLADICGGGVTVRVRVIEHNGVRYFVRGAFLVTWFRMFIRFLFFALSDAVYPFYPDGLPEPGISCLYRG